MENTGSDPIVLEKEGRVAEFENPSHEKIEYYLKKGFRFRSLDQEEEYYAEEKVSLYDRLGGIFPIALIVDDFSEAIIDNPIAGKDSANKQLRDWHRNQLDRLPGLKFQRTLWLAEAAGGPYTYVATNEGKCPMSLENAHSDLKISPQEFDAVAGELAKSLDRFKVPAKEKSEVLAAFSAHKGEVNTGFFRSAQTNSHVALSCSRNRRLQD